jgi:hypothetical protein
VTWTHALRLKNIQFYLIFFKKNNDSLLLNTLDRQYQMLFPQRQLKDTLNLY